MLRSVFAVELLPVFLILLHPRRQQVAIASSAASDRRDSFSFLILRLHSSTVDNVGEFKSRCSIMEERYRGGQLYSDLRVIQHHRQCLAVGPHSMSKFVYDVM